MIPGRACRDVDLHVDGLGIDPHAVRLRRMIAELEVDGDRHAESVGNIFLPDGAVQGEGPAGVDERRDREVRAVGRHVDSVDPLIEEPVHRLAEGPGDRFLERVRIGRAAGVVADEGAHHLPERRVVAGLEVDEHHAQHVQDERPLLVRQQPVVERRVDGGQPKAGHDRAGLVRVALADDARAQAVALQAQPLADPDLAQHVKAPRVEHLHELLFVAEPHERVERRRVVREALGHPLVAVVLPVDGRSPPLVRHLVRAEQLRLAGVQLPERAEAQQQEAGERLSAARRGLGDEQRVEGIGAEVVRVGPDRAREVVHRLLARARCESEVMAVRVDRNRRQAVERHLVDLESAVVERGRPTHRAVNDPAHDPGVVVHALLREDAAAGDPVAVGHAERHPQCPLPVVRVARYPVDRVLEQEVVGRAQPLDELPFVGELDHETLAGGHGPRQQHRHPRLVAVLLHPAVVLLLDEVDPFAAERNRLVRLRRLLGGFRRRQERHRADVVDAGRDGRPPARVGHLERGGDAQPHRREGHQRLDDQSHAPGRVAVALERQVDVGSGNPQARSPPLRVGPRGAQRQPEVPEAPFAVVAVAARVRRPRRLRVARKPGDGERRRGRTEVGQDIGSHPDLGPLVTAPEARELHLLEIARLDLEREPAVLPAVDLGVDVWARERPRRRVGLRAPQRHQDAAVRVGEPALEQLLAAILEQVRRPARLPPRRAVGQRRQPLADVARGPEDEALELLLQVILVQQLPHLLVLDAVRRPGADRAPAEVDRDRNALAHPDDVQIAVGQLEGEAVDLQPAAPDAADRLGTRLAQLVVEGRRAESVVLVVLNDSAAETEERGRQGGHERHSGAAARE